MDDIRAFIETNLFKVRYVFENAPHNVDEQVPPLISPV